MSRILIVEDEQHLADGLSFNLGAEGDVVEIADSGERALVRLESETFDLAVLDVMLPGMDGFTVASTMRQRGDFTPVLMLTARSRPEDVLRGFEAGADDYLAKPFELAIFMARVRGLLRRREWAERAFTSKAEDSVIVNGRRIDFNTLELRRDGSVAKLTAMEAGLLRYLLRNEGRTIPRKTMLAEVWGVREDTDTRAIDNFVARLRKYIEDDPAAPRHLVTVRGVGYRFVASPPPA